MSSRGDRLTIELPRNESVTVERQEQVVVGSGGDRFHKPGSLAFPTACKIGFESETETIPAFEAVNRGYLPCVKAQCFGP